MYLLILKRILWAVPTLLVITMLAFALSKAAPGDPVALLLDRTGDAPGSDPKRAAQAYQQTARILGLDRPAFYCALLPRAYVGAAQAKSSGLGATSWSGYLPVFQWYGLDNQYHHWLSGILEGDFGRSWRDGRPVGAKIRSAISWTLLLNFFALILSFGISIPLGVFMARHRGSWIDKSSKFALFFLYALPSFWIAVLLLIWLTGSAGGSSWVQLISDSRAQQGWAAILAGARRMAVPVFCLTYGSLAYIALQARSAMEEVLEQPYIRAALARGVPERIVIWRHAAKNAAFPLITLVGSIFPALVSGSVVVESVFNLPGMGKLTLDAIFGQDWPVVYAVLVLTATLTMLGLLVSDILYAWLDPRVRDSGGGLTTGP